VTDTTVSNGGTRSALLILDLQKDFLQPGGKLPVAQEQVPGMLEATNRTIKAADARGMEVIYIGNEFSPWDIPANWFRNSAAIRGQPGTRIDDRVLVINKQYFPKCRGNAFSNPRLVEFLRSRNVRDVILTGVYANTCVQFTAIGALRLGYRVTVLRDAVAAANPRKREVALERMQRRGIEILDSSSILEEKTGQVDPRP